MNFPLFNLVLVEPEIPNNTGNIGRTSVGAACRLHIVGKPTFDLDEKRVRRAGLDYWKDLDLVRHESWDSFLSMVPDKSRVFLFTTKSHKSIYENRFQQGDWLVFGKETTGLGTKILGQFPEQTLSLPIFGPVRSLNLANSVAIALYEAIRQVQFIDT